MPLVTLRDLHIRYRGPALLEGVNCQIEPGQRIGLLGRNGSGKTTLMRMLCGLEQPDHGEIVLSPSAKVALLPQDVPLDIHGTIREVVAQGVPCSAADSEHAAPWRDEQQVNQILSRMELDESAQFERLSSGMKRRVLLARSLVAGPDLLLLDEPTNHLDIAAVTWLEDFLSRWPTTYMFVTHDRMFLRRLATRILEIDRGRLFDWSCDYDTFLRRKEESLAAEEVQNAHFDRKLAEEEVWIRTGIKARRTRNEGRVRALEALRRIRSERRTNPGQVRMQIQEAQRSGVLVAEVEDVTFSYSHPSASSRIAQDVATLTTPLDAPDLAAAQPPYGERPILREFSTTVLRGDKIGVIGPNGAGKTTLLRVLLGQLPPQAGTVRLGTNLQIAYFDQLRQQLNDDRTVQESVADGSDTIFVNGQGRHIIGYLQDFLFSPERSRTLVKHLSGGERNRVLLARLFAKPANVIVLDEPTNDLDAETLELLEERLAEFNGTVLVVSHDREFLNNVVTSTIAFEPGGVREYVGGYDDWLRQRPLPTSAPPKTVSAKPTPPLPKPAAVAAKRRLSFKDQQELAALPAAIEQLEADIAALHAAMAEPDFYRQPGEVLAREQARLKSFDEKLATAFARWQELES